MKVVFLQDVARIAHKYDVKEVSGGYASNFLFPRKLAVVATPEMVSKVEGERAKQKDLQKMQEELLMKSLATLEGTVITLKEKANEEGHLYAKVQAPELIKALKAQAGIDLQSDHLTSKEPLKAVGEHTVDIEVQGKKSSFKVVIEAL